MSLEAKLLLQEFRTLVAEFGDKLPMTERYRESLLNRLHAELKSLRPEGGDRSARLLLEQVRRDWYTFTGYSQLKADIDHYLDESLPQSHEDRK